MKLRMTTVGAPIELVEMRALALRQAQGEREMLEAAE